MTQNTATDVAKTDQVLESIPIRLKIDAAQQFRRFFVEGFGDR